MRSLYFVTIASIGLVARPVRRLVRPRNLRLGRAKNVDGAALGATLAEFCRFDFRMAALIVEIERLGEPSNLGVWDVAATLIAFWGITGFLLYILIQVAPRWIVDQIKRLTNTNTDTNACYGQPVLARSL